MTTYDAKLHKKAIEAEAREEGLAKGLAEGLEKGLAEGLEKGLAEGLEKGLAEGLEKGLKKGMAEGIEQERIHSCQVLAESYLELGCTKEIAVNKLVEKYDLSVEEAGKIIGLVWTGDTHE